jgi:predicted phosphate transport protein (TIGR00153 family)
MFVIKENTNMPSLFNLFAKSPLKPLYEHISKVHQCCCLLPSFFECVFSDNWEKARDIQQQISAIEKEADIIKRQIRINLPNSLFMPVDRSDLLELLTQQDKIANKSKDIAGLMLGRQLHIPKEVEDDFMRYIKRCLDATELATKVIHELEDLLESGFRGKERKVVESMVKDLDMIEDDTDQIQIALRRNLYLRESEFNPIDAMFLYNVLDKIGDLADQAERVGARLELMISKS